MRADSSVVALPRLPRKRLLASFLAAVLIAGAGGFVTARALQAPAEDAAAVARRTVPVSAVVESRSIALPSFQARVTPSSQITAPITLPPGASAAVVTASPVAVGSSVTSGQWLLSISGRPLIALRVGTPFYRDLTVGDSGPDVRELNQALTDLGLRWSVVDAYDQGTVTGVANLYARWHLTAPGPEAGKSLSLREIISIGSDPVVVSEVAPGGTTAVAGDPALVLSGTRDEAVVRVDAATKAALAVGGSAAVTGPDFPRPKTGRITAISGFRDVDSSPRVDTGNGSADDPAEVDSSEEFPGYDVTVALVRTADQTGAALGSTLDVSFRSPGRKHSAVPLTEVKESGARTFVLKAGAKLTSTRVAIEILDQADGWVYFARTSALGPGDRVVISS